MSKGRPISLREARERALKIQEDTERRLKADRQADAAELENVMGNGDEPASDRECPMCLAGGGPYKCYAHADTKAYRCPVCGYTQADAAFNIDHHLCEAKGGPPMPERTLLAELEKQE